MPESQVSHEGPPTSGLPPARQAEPQDAAAGGQAVRVWPAGSATGIGSLPGVDPADSARLVLGELPALPFLPELPARGPHADLTGRTCALLSGLPVDLQPSGWRLVDRPGVDAQRARGLLERDLDALQEASEASPPPALKVQSAGPWTLAATLELTRGTRALADHGAVRDLTVALAEGLAQHLAELRRRVPSAALLLQLDEPALPAVLTARVATSSGFGTLRAPDPQLAVDHLRTVLSVAPDTVVHCCAARPPVRLLRRAGAGALSLDATLLTEALDDELGEALESGVGLLLGVVPALDAALPPVDDTLLPVRRLWRRLGLAAERLPYDVVPTPTCGLAGATPGYARAALRQVARAGTALHDEPL